MQAIPAERIGHARILLTYRYLGRIRHGLPLSILLQVIIAGSELNRNRSGSAAAQAGKLGVDDTIKRHS
jgi:hypothetical protein